MKLNLVFLLAIGANFSGCTSYSESDYADANTAISQENNTSTCVNMEPAQELKCKERENNLAISSGANENCSHLYEYQKKHCEKLKVKRQKLLDESLKKHTN